MASTEWLVLFTPRTHRFQSHHRPVLPPRLILPLYRNRLSPLGTILRRPLVLSFPSLHPLHSFHRIMRHNSFGFSNLLLLRCRRPNRQHGPKNHQGPQERSPSDHHHPNSPPQNLLAPNFPHPRVLRLTTLGWEK